MALGDRSDHASTANGPRRNVRIRIEYAGRAPGPVLSQKWLDLERRLHVDKAGAILRREAQDGAIDLVLVTADADRTREIAWKHVNDLGLSGRTTVRAEDVPRGR